MCYLYFFQVKADSLFQIFDLGNIFNVKLNEIYINSEYFRGKNEVNLHLIACFT